MWMTIYEVRRDQILQTPDNEDKSGLRKLDLK